MSHDIANAIETTRQQLLEFETRYGRQQGSVELMAVSKTKPTSLIRQAIAAGQRHFGENYLDEALRKKEELKDEDCVWHFIGAIQSNKTASIAQNFDWVHSIEREKIAKRLSDQRPDHLPPLNCCIQLNIDDEASKAGVSVDELNHLCAVIHELPGLHLRGFMSIPAPRDTLQQQREIFGQVATALERNAQQFPALDTLSMGMSSDIEAAVAEGSTMVRVGTAIFGARDYPAKQ